MMTHFIDGFFSILLSPVFSYILAFALPVSAFALACSVFTSRRDFDDK